MIKETARRRSLKSSSQRSAPVIPQDVLDGELSYDELAHSYGVMRRALLAIEEASWPDRIASNFNYMSSVRKIARQALEESSNI